MTPEQVLDKQLLIRSFWKQPDAKPFAEYMVEVIFKENRKDFDLLRHETVVLGQAETFYVTKDMGIQIEVMAQQLSVVATCPTSLPLVPMGFVWLEHPLTVLDANGIPMHIRAITWDSTMTVDMLAADRKVLQTLPTIFVSFYGDEEEGEDAERRLELMMQRTPNFNRVKYEEQRQVLHRYNPTLIHMTAITSDIRLSPNAVPERFMTAFWSLIRQPLVVTTRIRSSRAVQRRVARAKLKLSDVQVVDLRQMLSTPMIRERAESSGAQMSWQYRYRVTGHCKRQYYPKLGPARNPDGSWNEDSHRWIWVDDYEKGPEDAPLFATDRVFKVRR